VITSAGEGDGGGCEVEDDSEAGIAAARGAVIAGAAGIGMGAREDAEVISGTVSVVDGARVPRSPPPLPPPPPPP
jgi:hypothetical protein